MKQCSVCKKYKSLDKFYSRTGYKLGVEPQCIKCRNIYTNKWRKNFRLYSKQIMQQLKINGCAICGYNKSFRGLDFHHSNPEDKKFLLSKKIFESYSNEKIAEEINKCILLCKNCHTEIEDKEQELKL